jgi:hypothetical protein
MDSHQQSNNNENNDTIRHNMMSVQENKSSNSKVTVIRMKVEHGDSTILLITTAAIKRQTSQCCHLECDLSRHSFVKACPHWFLEWLSSNP